MNRSCNFLVVHSSQLYLHHEHIHQHSHQSCWCPEENRARPPGSSVNPKSALLPCPAFAPIVDVFGMICIVDVVLSQLRLQQVPEKGSHEKANSIVMLQARGYQNYTCKGHASLTNTSSALRSASFFVPSMLSLVLLLYMVASGLASVSTVGSASRTVVWRNRLSK